jgi:hypothetical protein
MLKIDEDTIATGSSDGIIRYVKSECVVTLWLVKERLHTRLTQIGANSAAQVPGCVG